MKFFITRFSRQGGELRLRHLVRFSQKGQFNLPPVRFTQVYAPQHQAFEQKAALGQVTVH